MKSKNLFFDILYYLLIFLSGIYVLLFLFCIEFPYNLKFASIFLISIFLFWALKKISQKLNWIYYFTNLCAIIITIITSLCFIILGFLLFLSHNVPRLLYPLEMRVLKQYYGYEKMKHFPQGIPLRAQNYYFYVDHGWDDAFSTLNFDINKNYIEKYNNENKSKCEYYGIYSDYNDKPFFENYPNLPHDSTVCFLHKQSSKNDYTKGYAIKNNRIYFFYECL